MYGLSPFKCNFVGSQVKNSKSIVLQSKLFDCIDSIIIELVLSQTQFLKPTVHLQHLGIVNSALLTYTFVVRTVEVQRTKSAVVPVENACYTNNSVDI